MRMLTNTQGQQVPDLGFGVSRNLTPQQLSRHYEEAYNNKVYYARYRTEPGFVGARTEDYEEWWDYNDDFGTESFLQKRNEVIVHEYVKYYDNTGALIKKITTSDGESSTYYYVNNISHSSESVNEKDKIRIEQYINGKRHEKLNKTLDSLISKNQDVEYDDNVPEHMRLK